MRELAAQQRQSGDTHFEGITYINLADAQRATGDIAGSMESASKAIELLQASSAGSEVSAAQAMVGWALAHQGELGLARQEIRTALSGMNDAVRFDVLYEATDAEATYGDITRASDYLAELGSLESDWTSPLLRPLASLIALRQGRSADAMRLAQETPIDRPTSLMAHKSRVLTLRAHAMLSAGRPAGTDALNDAFSHATMQSGGLWAEHCAAVRAVTGGSEEFSAYVRNRSRLGRWPLSRVAELIADRLHQLGDVERTVVLDEALLRPDRWRTALRLAVDAEGEPSVPAARLLEQVGDARDVARLRGLAHRHRGKPESELGRALARRIATQVFVEDQGRVSIGIGSQSIDGSSIRRKVLALLCFLLTRPRFAATRDQVMEALWPEFDPADALNSLNQTVYFLRRVFEPNYKDDLSPGYLHHESDVVWLDGDLVTSRSRRCLDLIQSMPLEPAPNDVNELATTYQGLFALDFTYEEWAAEYRTSLHSRYLQIIERAVASDTVSGHFERGIGLARRALDMTPEADQIELSLLRLYRLNGSHAAAAEQYAHYAAAIREALGVEPPALESL
jgi:DNA-binding SARP family transcriptional activator